MADRSVQCGDCGLDLDESPNEPNRTPCPTCGSIRRAINICVVEEVSFKEQVGLKIKDPTYTGKSKIKIEQLVGDDLHRKSGK